MTSPEIKNTALLILTSQKSKKHNISSVMTLKNKTLLLEWQKVLIQWYVFRK